jgi:hypothetical protein
MITQIEEMSPKTIMMGYRQQTDMREAKHLEKLAVIDPLRQ